ncbi:MAG: dienelactone hydrolase family protein [Bryobacteraceae bacterium]
MTNTRKWTISTAIVLAAGAVVLIAPRAAAQRAAKSAMSVAKPANASATLRSILPASADSKKLLETTQRCRDWVGIPYGDSVLLAFVVYPERSDKAPVVFVSAKHEGFNPWARAVADQVAGEGFIAIAADVMTSQGPKGGDSEAFASPDALHAAMQKLGPAEIARRENAIREYALALPAADGKSADLVLDSNANLLHASVAGKGARDFRLGASGWSEGMRFLTEQTNNRPQMGEDTMMMAMDHSGHMGHGGMMTVRSGMAMAPQRGVSAAGSVGAAGTSTVEKQPNLPAGFYTALSTLNKSKLRKEWVDIPYGDIKLHTWVEYPAGEGKAGVVLVMQFGTGMDEWIRAVADQVAQEGFIAVAPDMWSGTGPNGGGRDSFQFVDDAMRAGAKITGDEKQKRYRAAWEWAMKLPRANGKSATIGFCDGGGQSFRFAALNPEVNGAVVYYGTPPTDAEMANIKAPVIGFYGENDARVTSTVAPTTEKMEKLGKVYEPHVYTKTTHSFLYFQEMAGNPAATNDAWPRTVAFFKKHLN